MDAKKAVIWGLTMTAAAVPVVGYTFSLPLRIRYEKAGFKNLPSHLRGLKILHIADLHGRYPHKMHRDIWSHLLNLDFDMVVLTGDVILGSITQLYPHLDGLRALTKKAPAFYVDGNHERFCYNEMARLMESVGVTPLYNRRGNFAVGAYHKGVQPVVSIAGFRDYEYLYKNRFEGVTPLLDDIAKSDKFHILLTHQPQAFDLIDKTPKDTNKFSALMLAGHTHGGQVRLPFFPTLFAPGQGILPQYGDGWYEKDDGRLKLFISRGVGATTFPLRMFNPSEVAVIELLRT